MGPPCRYLHPELFCNPLDSLAESCRSLRSPFVLILHPWKINGWNLGISPPPRKRNFIFQTIIFRFSGSILVFQRVYPLKKRLAPFTNRHPSLSLSLSARSHHGTLERRGKKNDKQNVSQIDDQLNMLYVYVYTCIFVCVIGFIDRFVFLTKYIFVSLLWNMAALKVGPSYLVAFQQVNPSHSNRSIFGTGCWICSIWSLSRNWWQVLFRTIVGCCTSEKMCYRLSLWLVLLLLLFLDLFTVFFNFCGIANHHSTTI